MSYSQQLKTESEILSRQNYDPLNLRGRIELVFLSQYAHGQNSAVGEILRNNQKVLVTSGQQHIGKLCLARLDLERRSKSDSSGVEKLCGDDEAIFLGDEDQDYIDFYPLKANFISTEIPFGFGERLKCGAGPEEYVLYGRWRKSNRNANRSPTLDEINEIYDPGKIGQFVYISGDKKFDEKVFLINYWRKIPIRWYLGLGELLPNPLERSRVIISDSKRRIKELREELIEEGFIPIRMEELKLN